MFLIISGTSDSIATRLDNCEYQLTENRSRFLGSVLDLENTARDMEARLAAIVQPVKPEISVQLEEFADVEGILADDSIPESVWLESLRNKTGLDFRALVDFYPIRELGLERFEALVMVNGKPVAYDLKLWVVPVQE